MGALGQPTCLADVGAYIVVGGSRGGLVCIPRALVSGGTGEAPFELQESKTYLGSFFNRYALLIMPHCTFRRQIGRINLGRSLQAGQNITKT